MKNGVRLELDTRKRSSIYKFYIIALDDCEDETSSIAIVRAYFGSLSKSLELVYEVQPNHIQIAPLKWWGMKKESLQRIVWNWTETNKAQMNLDFASEWFGPFVKELGGQCNHFEIKWSEIISNVHAYQMIRA